MKSIVLNSAVHEEFKIELNSYSSCSRIIHDEDHEDKTVLLALQRSEDKLT